MPKNKAKGRRRAGGQARGAEKGEQRQIRAAVARHNTLTHLDLSGCSSLKELPHSIYALSSLTRLNLSGCSGLVAPFEMIGGATALTELDASNC